MSYKQLSSFIYPTTNKSYRTFTIKKKGGGERTISVPKKNLKKIQRMIVDKIMKYYNPKLSCHGFTESRSIVTNAYRHVGKQFVFNVDLKDFFGTIHFGRVRNLFISKPFLYSHSAATVLAQICCKDGVLPQGAPTSPIISNLICWKLDAQLQTLAAKNNCHYTRYADDITFSFSCNKKYIPKSILDFDNDGVVVVGSSLERIIKENGFNINYEKVRLKGRSQRQEVTGITVNEFTNVERKFIRKTRSMIHAWRKFGSIKAQEHYISNYLEKDILPRQAKSIAKNDGEFFIDVVKGRVNYIQMVRGRADPIYRKLAYQMTLAMGKPNHLFLRKAEEVISDSVFIVENNLLCEQGSAFLLDDIGIVTNQHVVEGIDHENHELVDFYREDDVKNKMNSSFVYSSASKDIAIFLATANFNNIPPLPIGNDKNLRVGDSIIVVGYPDYSEGETAYINRGKIVQSILRFGKRFWLIDIPVIHGNSGGPVLNEKLEVVGIATLGSAINDGKNKFNGFVPISTLTGILNTPQYNKIYRYSLLHSKKPKVEIEKDLFYVDGLTYCKKCFLDKKQAITVYKTKSNVFFNCKICGKTYRK
ncbi:reverse transcriptase domain-containing protein [Marinobacterium mangrovicola]|nr:reverse transcriptase domain-containing protein [Marinobacterium mangrovicola]